MKKTITRLVSALALAGLLGGALVGVSQAAPAVAATASNFDAGHIIDDALFFNGSLMSEAQIQSFIASRETGCAPTAGNPGCLKNYTTASTPRAADQYCPNAYAGGTADSASHIIFAVAQACNISPQVLLVTLQKEEGLVLSNDPSAAAYTIAMGYGCPDTAACSTLYSGFGNQVFDAARQFQAYRVAKSSFNYRAGQNNTIQWSPAASCGSSVVYIQNDATAALYNYTPYRPNQAALNNLYGTGDGCSAYGNRNFWTYYTDWFGPTTLKPGAAAFVTSLYADILGRTPSQDEVLGWGTALTNGAAPVTIAASFVNSDEYRLMRINAAYTGVLGRAAAPAEAQGWLNNMRNGLLQTDDVDRIFLATDEYFNNNGGTNDSFVAALYVKLIGRPATPSEIPGWSAIAASRGRQFVVNQIWNSIETARSRVSIMYQSYLGRPPAPGEVDGWATIAITQGDAGVRWSIMGSQEYWNRAQTRFPST